MFDVEPITSQKPYDCGPTCLQMLLAYYGTDVPLDTLIEECHVGVAGCTGADILRAGRLHGLDMQCYSIDADELVRQDRPAIVSWKYNHWVVFCGRDDDGRVAICNPDIGRFRMSEGTFKSFFTGLDDYPGQGVAITNGEPEWLGVPGNIGAGEYFEHDGSLWRALRNMARGERIVEHYNAERTDVTEVLSELGASQGKDAKDKDESEEQ